MTKKKDLKAAENALVLMTCSDPVQRRETKVDSVECDYPKGRVTSLGRVYSNRHRQMQYGVVKGGKVIFVNYDVCYGYLSSNNPFFKGTDLIFVLNSSGTSSGSDSTAKEACKLPLFDWFINESPWASIILTKDPKWVMDYGIVINANAPANLVGGAMLAFRDVRFLEKHKVNFFEEMVKLKVNTNLTFILLNLFNYISREEPYASGGSQLFHYNVFSMKNVEGFCSGTPLNKTDTYKNLGYYRSVPPFLYDTTVRQTFCDSKNGLIQKDEDYSELYSDFYRYLSKCRDSNSVNNNPFGISGNSISIKENYVIVAKWCKKTFKHLH